mmetsp:Transcript_43471/g.111184  ORF Transcript_43471/g.111184 Transcript_43471/m.111184 type:complete len:94 (+) Transcript_43471:702-983(+)
MAISPAALAIISAGTQRPANSESAELDALLFVNTIPDELEPKIPPTVGFHRHPWLRLLSLSTAVKAHKKCDLMQQNEDRVEYTWSATAVPLAR